MKCPRCEVDMYRQEGVKSWIFKCTRCDTECRVKKDSLYTFDENDYLVEVQNAK